MFDDQAIMIHDDTIKFLSPSFKEGEYQTRKMDILVYQHNAYIMIIRQYEDNSVNYEVNLADYYMNTPVENIIVNEHTSGDNVNTFITCPIVYNEKEGKFLITTLNNIVKEYSGTQRHTKQVKEAIETVNMFNNVIK